jgi:hypothetical protein
VLSARWEAHLNNRRFTSGELAVVADWCNRNLPPDATLLVHDAGYISYATRFRLTDMVGLKTPGNIPFHVNGTWRTCGAGRGAAVAAIAREQHPDYLVMLRGWDRIYRITDGLRAAGFRLDELRHVREGYEVYRLTPPQ